MIHIDFGCTTCATAECCSYAGVGARSTRAGPELRLAREHEGMHRLRHCFAEAFAKHGFCTFREVLLGRLVAQRRGRRLVGLGVAEQRGDEFDVLRRAPILAENRGADLIEPERVEEGLDALLVDGPIEGRPRAPVVLVSTTRGRENLLLDVLSLSLRPASTGLIRL